jgi:hypothetical protein
VLVKLKVSLLPPREWISEGGGSGLTPATVIGTRETAFAIPPKVLKVIVGRRLSLGYRLMARVTAYDEAHKRILAEARLSSLNSRVVKKLRRDKWKIDENLLTHHSSVPQVA